MLGDLNRFFKTSYRSGSVTPPALAPDLQQTRFVPNYYNRLLNSQLVRGPVTPYEYSQSDHTWSRLEISALADPETMMVDLSPFSVPIRMVGYENGWASMLITLRMVRLEHRVQDSRLVLFLL